MTQINKSLGEGWVSPPRLELRIDQTPEGIHERRVLSQGAVQVVLDPRVSNRTPASRIHVAITFMNCVSLGPTHAGINPSTTTAHPPARVSVRPCQPVCHATNGRHRPPRFRRRRDKLPRCRMLPCPTRQTHRQMLVMTSRIGPTNSQISSTTTRVVSKLRNLLESS